VTTTIARPARGVVSSNLVSRFSEIFDRKSGFMNTYNVEREEQIELMGISLVAGIDPLFIGDPGVGKTWMIELLLKLIDGANDDDFFNTLVFKETPADDILGPRSIPAMKAGKIERIQDGYIGTAVLAYLDEIFKASPTLVNSLLDVMANRKLKVGKTVHDLGHLLAIYGSSNELPDREDMNAFRDRWAITNVVPPVRTPEGRKRVMTIQDEFQAGGGRLDLSQAPMLALQDIMQIRTEVRGIIMPDTVKETLSTAMDRWEGKGFLPSMRRQGAMILAMKGRAWTHGRDHVTTDDMILLQHMAWNHPDHANDAHDVVMEFANVFARKAARAREALEPVIGELDRIKGEMGGGEPTDKHLEDAFKQMRQLRVMTREVKSQISEGTKQGHDTTDLEDVLNDINRAHSWANSALTLDDEE
jgi:MoxR-like ATPase